MTTTNNIVRLAELQENGELPPTAEDAIALAFADRHAHESALRGAMGALAELRRHALGL